MADIYFKNLTRLSPRQIAIFGTQFETNLFYQKTQNFMISSKDAIALENKYGAKNYKPLPVVLAKGEGVYVWETRGTAILKLLER